MLIIKSPVMKNSRNSSDYWLSVAEAAARSHCSQQAIRVRILKGKFSAMKRYGQWLINTRSLQNYLRDQDQPKEAVILVSPGWEY